MHWTAHKKSHVEEKRVVYLHAQLRPPQMAEGLLQAHYGAHFNAYSAGLKASRVKPLAVAVMEEVGIDMSFHYSKTLEHLGNIPMDYVVTVCDAAHEACPYAPARIRVIHKGFPHPSAEGHTEAVELASFRQVRDEIKAWLDTEFVSEIVALDASNS